MKKRVSFFAVLLAVLTMLVPNVSAIELKDDKMDLDKPFTFGEVKFEKYDADSNINYYNVKVNVDGSVITKVLAQRPGNKDSQASLGSFYLGLRPKVVAKEYIKNGIKYTDNNLAATKAKLDESLKTEKPSPNNGFWVPYLKVQYLKDGVWTNVTTKGDGTKSIAENLVALTGVASESDLVYGKNYRFFLEDNLQYIVGWQYTEGEGEEAKTVTEYVNVSYEISFPISATDGKSEYYFPTLEDAMASELKDITIAENIEISDDLDLKGTDKNITIKKGVKVTVADGKTLTNEVTINNYGTIEGSVVNKENLYNYGTVKGNVASEGYLQNTGTLTGNVTGAGELYNEGTVEGNVEADDVYNEGKINGNVVADVLDNENEITGDVEITTGFINNGTIDGDITNSEGKKFYHILFPEGTENGGVYPIYGYNMEVAGNVVTLTSWTETGYELQNLKIVYTKDGKEVEVKFTEKKDKDGYTYYQFTMPEGDVKVTAKVAKIKNPNTYDGILGYCVTGAISVVGLIALVLAVKFSKKTN